MIEPRLIPVTPELEKHLTEEWSDPVQVRIIDGEFVARKVYREKDEALAARNALPKIRTNDGIPEGWYVSIGEDGVPELRRIRG